MKISLCMIAGNEQARILKCLDSAREAFDELCLVLATGSLEYDQTRRLAEDWCERNEKKFRIGFYRNVHELPHVDDFGAARNMSFDLATGDWILWLDCDDCLDEINCARIREASKVCAPDVTGIFATYLVEKNGAEIMRERLIRRGFGRWKNAIHETCEITGTVLQCPQIRVIHSDHSAKHESSAKRNAAILERVLQDAPRHFFYAHCEQKACGKSKESIYNGHVALEALHPSQVEEIYTVLLNLSELEPDQRDKHLMEAARLQPHRREAFAYLCQSALIGGRLSDAVSYFRLMDSLPLPAPLPWTHQGIWYGWARNVLRVRLLRATGQTEQAAIEHEKHLSDTDYAEGMKTYE